MTDNKINTEQFSYQEAYVYAAEKPSSATHIEPITCPHCGGKPISCGERCTQRSRVRYERTEKSVLHHAGIGPIYSNNLVCTSWQSKLRFVVA
jgi:hypothetical protein